MSVIEVAIPKNIPDEHWKCIKAFQRRAGRLSQTQLASDPEAHSVNLRLVFDASGFHVAGDAPSDAVLVEHSAAFRFFTMEKSPSNFLRVLRILSRHATNDDQRSVFRHLKEQWIDTVFTGFVRMEVNGKELTGPHLTNLWFNGEYFHDDEDKLEELERMWAITTRETSKALLTHALINGTNVVFKLDRGLRSLHRERVT